jgi:hypothetical protein
MSTNDIELQTISGCSGTNTELNGWWNLTQILKDKCSYTD